MQRAQTGLRRWRLMATVAVSLGVFCPATSRAQYTANFQTNIISGISSNWLGAYYVGYTNFADALVIENGGELANGLGSIGSQSSSSNNSVLVAGTGSVWTNGQFLYVGGDGIGNNLTISNGGRVTAVAVFIGYHSASNSVLICGADMITSRGSFLYVGNTGSDNRLVISNSGWVVSGYGAIGQNPSSARNLVEVKGSGSVWTNAGTLYVGSLGPNNRLMIRDGGRVINQNGYLSVDSLYSQSRSNLAWVTDAGSIWQNNSALYIGNFGEENSLVISNEGQVWSTSGYVGGYGSYISGNNNRVWVGGTGSTWSNSETLKIGGWGGGNTLVIRDGGRVLDNTAELGQYYSSRGNSAQVAGLGSAWEHATSFSIGAAAVGTSLLISNYGAVVNTVGYVGRDATSSNNVVEVADRGVWNNGILYIGYAGRSNLLNIAGGTVCATNLVVGFASAQCDNTVRLSDGSVLVTNSLTNAVLEVAKGSLIVSGGLLMVDTLVLTNPCARFIRTGGTLIAGSVVLDPNLDADGDGMANGWEQAYSLDPFNAADAGTDPDGDGFSNLQEFQAGTDPTNSASAFRILGVAVTNDDLLVTWAAGGGRTNVVQVATDLAGGYSNVSPDIVLAGSGVVTTNYLDAGATTNGSSRYYRLRLVP